MKDAISVGHSLLLEYLTCFKASLLRSRGIVVVSDGCRVEQFFLSSTMITQYERVCLYPNLYHFSPYSMMKAFLSCLQL